MARILVADHDKPVRDTIRALLLHKGFDVDTAEDGSSTIRALAAIDFDLAIIDMFMPGLEGLETIRALRRRYPDTPIIATSSLVFPERKVTTPDFLGMATKLGAAASLRKPFKPHDLIVAVDACVGRRPH